MGRYTAPHLNPKGPGDARPTAQQIISDNSLTGAMRDKTIVITGCSSGIGIETARALHTTGATLFVTARNAAKAQPVVASILADDSTNDAPVHLVVMDNADLGSVRRGAAEIWHKSGGRVNVLINNAGVMATPEQKTKNGFELQLGTNHVAHFLLFMLLKDALLAASTPEFNSRVVNLSSIGHRYGKMRLDDPNFTKPNSYVPWIAYGQAKTANIWMANSIERRYGSSGLHAWSLHPGGIDTGLQVHVQAEIDAMKEQDAVRRYMKSLAQGAATTVWAAVAKELEGQPGKYCSNCEVQGPMLEPPVEEGQLSLSESNEAKEEMVRSFDGYAPWAYDEEAEERLWEMSLGWVGLEQ